MIGRVLPKWQGESCYIIGGGPSLAGYDYTPIMGENVIGCNDAYRLGSWVDYCLFVDWKWHDHHVRKGTLREYEGTAITAYGDAEACDARFEDFVHVLRRINRGWSSEPTAMAYNSSCGAMAVNLAHLLGATTVYLLGYDGKRDEETGENNWHPNALDDVTDEVHARHAEGHRVAAVHARKSGMQVWNLNPESVIGGYDKVGDMQEAGR